MPQVSSLFTITGNAGGLCFFKANDKTFVRKPTSLFGDRWWNKRTMRRAQERALEFGGASQAANHVRSQLPLHIRKLTHRYSHNRLAMAIRKACQEERSRNPQNYPTSMPAGAAGASRTLSTYSATGIASAITDLQLGNAQGNQQPIISTRHAPQSGLHISIHGLQNHAHSTHGSSLPIETGAGQASMNSESAPSTHGSSLPFWGRVGDGVEFRIHICFATTADIVRDPHSASRHAGFAPRSIPDQAGNPESRSTQWATLHGIDPATDRLDLPAIPLPEIDPAKLPKGSQLLVFIAIEWRQRNGRRIKNLRSMSTVQGLIAVPISADATPQASRPARIHAPKARAHRLQRQMTTHPRSLRLSFRFVQCSKRQSKLCL